MKNKYYDIVYCISNKELEESNNRYPSLLKLIDIVSANNTAFKDVKKYIKIDSKRTVDLDAIFFKYNSDTNIDYSDERDCNPELFYTLVLLLYYDYMSYYTNYISKLPFLVNDSNIDSFKIYRGVDWAINESEDCWFIFPKWCFTFKYKRPRRYIHKQHYSDRYLYINIDPLTKRVNLDSMNNNINTHYKVFDNFYMYNTVRRYMHKQNLNTRRQIRKVFNHNGKWDSNRYKALKYISLKDYYRKAIYKRPLVTKVDSNEEYLTYDLFENKQEGFQFDFNKELLTLFGKVNEVCSLKSLTITPYYLYNTYIDCLLKNNEHKFYYFLQEERRFHFEPFANDLMHNLQKYSKSFIEAKSEEELFVTEFMEHRYHLNDLTNLTPINPNDSLEKLCTMHNFINSTDFQLIRLI